MARKDPALKIKDLQEQMKKIEKQLKEQERKRDEELGRIFREEWNIEDSDTARLIIETLKEQAMTLIGSKENEDDTEDKSSSNEAV